MTEILDIVDEDGIPTGQTVEREKAHREGIRHRTSHVWLVRYFEGAWQILLQKRSENKDSFPGCWDISSAGHIPAGQDFEESALRELKEELGLEIEKGTMIICGQRHFEFQKKFHGRPFHDNQVSRVFVLPIDLSEDDFILQESEISAVRWMNLDECMRAVREDRIPNCIDMEELEMVKAAVQAQLS